MKHKLFKRSRGMALAAALFFGVTAVSLGAFSRSVSAEETQASGEAAQEAAKEDIALTGQIRSCKVTADKQNVEIAFSTSGDTAGTDGKVYIFEQQTYENSLDGRTDYIASADALISSSAQVPLNFGSTADRLYSKFVLAAYDGTEYKAISEPHYITNPEAVAKNTEAFKDPLTKKGLNIEIDMLEDAFDLGVKHVTTNIAFSQIMGTGIEYEYDGKIYHLIRPSWMIMTEPSALFPIRE